MLTINVTVLLVIIVFVRLRRPVEPRTRLDQAFGIVVILALGLLLAPTEFGHSVLGAVRQHAPASAGHHRADVGVGFWLSRRAAAAEDERACWERSLVCRGCTAVFPQEDAVAV
ncbi:hypothetical protein [Streptomyces sp. NPDC004296]|uniref:hypothetical protein n=1 Tax=Streptomyces sp. NPDC004296 TaxID=3364697 RepID=UPI0036A30DCD